MLWGRRSRVRRLQKFPCSLQDSRRQCQRWTHCNLLCWLQPRTCLFRLCRHPLRRLWLCQASASTRPLSQAALQAGMHVLSVDPLCAGQLDLFNDLHYEQLLRLSFSGAVWFACASPPCGDFSTIKLRPGPGPKPIRTREYPFGILRRKCFSTGPPSEKLVPFGTFSLYLTGSFPSWGPYQSGAAPKCFVLAAVHGATLFIGGQRFLLLYCCLCFWHECSQTLDIRYIFCGPQCFGMCLQS